MPRIKYIRPNSVLTVRCGLLAKWLRVRVRVGLGPGNALVVLFFSLWYYKCGKHLRLFGGSVSARRTTYEYSIDDVTATWIEVKLSLSLVRLLVVSEYRSLTLV